MNIIIFIVAFFALIFAIARFNPAFKTVAIIVAAFLAIFTFAGGFSAIAAVIVWMLFLIPAILLGSKQIRKQYLSIPLLKRIKKVLPPMSETERDAIEAGTVWWESELFRGAPDWSRLQSYAKPQLSQEEQAFIDGPVEELLLEAKPTASN